MALRILHVLDHSIPMHSGYTFRTAAILREQRALGWETYQLTSPKHTAPGPEAEVVDGLHFYRTIWRASGPFAWSGVKELALMKVLEDRIDEVVALVQPDIVHAHSPVLNALPAIRVARRRRLPIVYEIRAFWEDGAVDHGTTREGSMRYRMTRSLETRAMCRADHVTTICEGLRGDILKRGIPSEKVTIIPNAVDVEAFAFCPPRDEELRQRLGLEGTIVIGFVGSFYAYEGLDLLIDAVPGIVRVRPNTRVLLVGGGPQEEALKAQAKHLGIGDKVRFVGRVPHSDVQRYYSLIDVLAYPRQPVRLTELVTPLKPLEAMAQGKLLIASDVGGHRELIRDRETGVLFKAGSADAIRDAVLELLSQPERWDAIRESGRRFVEDERTWSQSVGRYDDVYRRVLERASLMPA